MVQDEHLAGHSDVVCPLDCRYAVESTQGAQDVVV